MLLSLFKPNQPIVNFFTPLIVLMLWLPVFWKDPIFLPAHPMPFYVFIYQSLQHLPHWLIHVLCILLVSFQAIYFNYIINHYEVLFRKSNIPLVIYILISALLPSMQVFGPVMVANTLILLILDKSFRLYKNPHPLSLIFDIWTLLAIATLIHFPVIILVFLLWIELFFLRPFFWREWIVGIFGFCVPYLFLTLYYFWNDRLREIHALFFQHHFTFDLIHVPLSTSALALLLFLGALFILAVLKLQGNFYKNVIKTRGYQQVFISLLVFTALSVLFSNTSHLSNLVLLVVPFSLFISYYFLILQKNFWAETLFFLLIIGIVFAHFN